MKNSVHEGRQNIRIVLGLGRWLSQLVKCPLNKHEELSLCPHLLLQKSRPGRAPLVICLVPETGTFVELFGQLTNLLSSWASGAEKGVQKSGGEWLRKGTTQTFECVHTYTCVHSSMNMHIFSLLHTGLPSPPEGHVADGKRIWGRTGYKDEAQGGVSHAECSGFGIHLVPSTGEGEGKVARQVPLGYIALGLHPENQGQGNTEMQRRDLSVTRIISESEHSMRKKKDQFGTSF